MHQGIHRQFRTRLPALLTGAAGLVLFFPRLLGGSHLPVFRDLQTLFLPQKSFLAGCLRAGEAPFWNPYILCGAPFLSDPQAGVFYPPSLLFLLPSFPLAFNLFVLLHVALLFAFTRLWLRDRGVGESGALVGALAATFGGYGISSVNILNNLTAFAWFPAVLWGFARLRREPGPGREIAAVVLLALLLLAGEPQIVLFAAGFVLLDLLAHARALRREPGRLLVLARAAVLGAALTAVQWLPTWLDLRRSVRAEGLSLADAGRFAVDPGMLVHLVVPFRLPGPLLTSPAVLHDYPGSGEIPNVLTVYLGVLVVPLALLALARGRGGSRWVWAAVAVLGILASLGTVTPLYGALHGALPVFRFPSKFLLPAAVALVLLAARGVDLLPRPLARWRWALVPLLLVDLFLAHAGLNPALPVDRVFPALDHDDLSSMIGDRFWTDETGLVAVDEETTVGDYVEAWRGRLRPNTNVLVGVEAIGGRTALELASQWSLTEALRRDWSDRIRLLRLAGVGRIASGRDLGEVEGLVGDPGNGDRYRLEGALPRAFAVGKVVQLPPQSAAELEHGGFPLPRFDPAVAAWTAPGGPDPARFPEPGAWSVAWERPAPSVLRLNARPDRPALVVVTESHHPGWSARVNGTPATVHRVDNLFLGIEVPAGESVIELRFRPPGLGAGAAVSAAGGLALALVAGLGLRRRRG